MVGAELVDELLPGGNDVLRQAWYAIFTTPVVMTAAERIPLRIRTPQCRCPRRPADA
jgi:hypothetical protein